MEGRWMMAVAAASRYGVTLDPRLCSFAACGQPLYAAQLCHRHYGRRQRHGTPGCPTCRERDLAPNQRQCLECIAADFRRLGYEPMGIAGYQSTAKAIMCRCLTCGRVARKRLENLRAYGTQCGGCWAPMRAVVAAGARFTQERAAEILDRAGWTLLGKYRNANTPVAAVCQGCGKIGHRRVGNTHAKLKEGISQFGCMACAKEKFPPPSAIPPVDRGSGHEVAAPACVVPAARHLLSDADVTPTPCRLPRSSHGCR